LPHWRTELPELGLLVRFTAYMGLRAGETAGLRVGKLDFLRSSVEVCESATEVNGQLVYGPTKNYQRRRVPLLPFLRDDLAAHLQAKRRDQSDFVFASPEGGPLRHNNFYRRHFKPAVLQAGLPVTVRFHDLRHSYAGLLIAQGAHPRAIMSAWAILRSRSRWARTATFCPGSMNTSRAGSTTSGAPPGRAPERPISSVGSVGIEPTTEGL